jgi:hypothetical protein
MNNIRIDIQNAAQNMIVGSKQHALFNPVASNNPALITSTQAPNMSVPMPTPEYSQIKVVGIDMGSDDQNATAVCVRQTHVPNMPIGGSDGGRGLNSQLYGSLLSLCSKQFISV